MYGEFDIHIEVDPLVVFSKIIQEENVFLLESLGSGQFSKFTYIGFNPKYVISGYEDHVVVVGLSGVLKKETSSPCEELKRCLNNIKQEENTYHYSGGLVGYFSYDAASYFCPAKIRKSSFPKFEFGFYEDGLIYNRETKEYKYFTRGHDRRDYILGLLSKETNNFRFILKGREKDTTRTGYQRAFKEAKENIKAGNIFQLVLSIGSRYEIIGDPICVYKYMREINPSPHMYFIKFGQKIAIGASPELLFKSSFGTIEHKGTLAGTIRRGANKEEDSKLIRKLLNNQKERAEHLMLVDLARNDLGIVSQFGTVNVKHMMNILQFSHVQHISSTVVGVIKPGLNDIDVIASCFPAGTLTGCPKIMSMTIIDKIEKTPRGLYGGMAGYFSFNGAMFAIMIRSLFINGQIAYSRSGSGIVADSSLNYEYNEIMMKNLQLEIALKRASKNH